MFALRRPPPAPPASPECLVLSRAILHCTAQVLRGGAGEAPAIVEAYCRALTGASTHLPLVWAWFGDAHAREVHPQVAAGRGVAWARGLRIARNLLTRHGPAFRALDGRPSEPFSVSTLSIWAPWRDAARTQGIRSVLCLPLQPGPGHGEGGVLVLYADTRDYFEGLTGFFESVAEMFGSILAQSAAHAALSRRATTDALTGVGNRLQFDHLCEALGTCAAGGPPTTVVIADLDRFKSVNDRFGHHAGDTVLKGTASLLLRAVRHNDSVLRLGGEEFAVVLPNTSAAQAAEVAEAMRYRLDGHRHDVEAAAALQVTGSFGVAQLMPGESLREALRRADAALYLAKQAGRNRVCLATAETPLADEPHSPTTNTVLALFRTN